MSILDEIAKKYGTDKSSEVHNYCVKYEKYLPFKRDEHLNILEIGVLNGESLKMWKEYFYNSHIVGIDINPECKKYEEQRVSVEIGSQVDGNFLSRLWQQYGPFDMILDDGSHMNEHVIYSFEHLFGSVKSGGVYIVEDVCTTYWENYGGKRYGENTMLEYFKGITDEVNFFGEILENHNISLARREDKLIEQFEIKGYNYIGTQFESINFLNGIIILTKR